MKAIWKFPLVDRCGLQFVAMPLGAEILTVQMQGTTITLWAKVNTENPMESVPIQIVGTGNPYDSVGDYIGTVQLDMYVWHIFKGEQ